MEEKIASLDLQYASSIQMTCMNDDPEVDHECADAFLVEMLKEIGCHKTADAYKAVLKYYA